MSEKNQVNRISGSRVPARLRKKVALSAPSPGKNRVKVNYGARNEYVTSPSDNVINDH